MLRSSLICIRGEGGREQGWPRRDGLPESDAVWLEVLPWETLVPVNPVLNSNVGVPDCNAQPRV